MKKILIITAALLMLSGCSLIQTKPVETKVTSVEKAPLVLPAVETYRHLPVEWIVMTPQVIAKTFERLKAEGGNVVLIGLTDKGYENLAKNNSALLEIIQQYNLKIKAYEDYYKLEVKKPEDQ